MATTYLPPVCRGSHHPPLDPPIEVKGRMWRRGVCSVCGYDLSVRLDGLVIMHRNGTRRRPPTWAPEGDS